MQPRKIIFVCLGNTCRSPMAAAIARKILGNSIYAQSVGIETADDMVATQEAILVMDEMGYDIRGHRSQGLESINLKDFDIIVAMSPSIADELRKIYPIDDYKIKIWNVSDPYGTGIENYRQCAKNMEDLLADLSESEFKPQRTN